MLTSASRLDRNSDVGSSAIASLRALFWNRTALAMGRKVHTVPSLWRYAFSPSKIDWP